MFPYPFHALYSGQLLTLPKQGKSQLAFLKQAFGEKMYSFTFGVCAMATEPVFLAGRQLSNRVSKSMG